MATSTLGIYVKGTQSTLVRTESNHFTTTLLELEYLILRFTHFPTFTWRWFYMIKVNANSIFVLRVLTFIPRSFTTQWPTTLRRQFSDYWCVYSRMHNSSLFARNCYSLSTRWRNCLVSCFYISINYLARLLSCVVVHIYIQNSLLFWLTNYWCHCVQQNTGAILRFITLSAFAYDKTFRPLSAWPHTEVQFSSKRKNQTISALHNL